MRVDKDKKKGHAAGYAILLLVALIVILALLAGVFVTSDIADNSHEHTWDDGAETVAATCDGAGTVTYTCAGCGETKEEMILPLGHDWQSEYTEATCVDAGYVTQACSRCGTSQTIPGAMATDIHTMGEEYERIESTCVKAGELRYSCVICGRDIAEEIPATGEHVWGDGEVTTAATCEKAGAMTYTCTQCGEETMTAEIPALGHEWENEYCDATCVSAGYVLQTCSRCAATQTITGAKATGVHIMGEEYERTEPTCAKAGELKYTCIICEQEITEEIPATGEHNWDEGEVTEAATCTEDGETTYTCTICAEATKTEPIAALGHELKTTHTDATCVAAGSTVAKCTRCDYEETTPGDGPTGIHKRGDDAEYATVPDCETGGRMTYTCEVCNQEIEENVPALGHDYRVPDAENPEFAWSLNRYNEVLAALVLTCARCGGTSEVEASVTDNGDGTYTAIVTYSGMEYKDETGDPFEDYDETCSSNFEDALAEGGKIMLTEDIDSASSLDLVDGTEIYLGEYTIGDVQMNINGDVTIRGGTITGGNQVINVAAGAEAELLGCEITGETQVVYVASKGEAELVNCDVTANGNINGNDSLIGVRVTSADVTLEQCTITATNAGSADSSAMYMSASNAAIKDCEITSTSSGSSNNSNGIYISDNSSVVEFDDCTIKAASTGSGAAYGVYLFRGSVTLNTSEIKTSTQSGAAYGVYIYNDNTGSTSVTRSATISGCEITAESATGSGYGIADKGGNYGTKSSFYTLIVSGSTITGSTYAVYIRESSSSRSFADDNEYVGTTSGI